MQVERPLGSCTPTSCMWAMGTYTGQIRKLVQQFNSGCPFSVVLSNVIHFVILDLISAKMTKVLKNLFQFIINNLLADIKKWEKPTLISLSLYKKPQMKIISCLC